MPPLTKAQILCATPRIVPFPVPEWGGDAYLRPMSVADLVAFMGRKDDLPDAQLYPFLAGLSLCDEAGTRLFEDGDLDALSALQFDVIKRVGEKAMEINHIGATGEADAKNG